MNFPPAQFFLRALFVLLFAANVAVAAPAGEKAKSALRCYDRDDSVPCLLGLAREKLARVTSPDERADTLGEFLYVLAATQTEDGALLREARTLADDPAVRPVKQMDLLYSIDLYENAFAAPAEDSFKAALARFAALERRLAGMELIELHLSACLMIDWDDPLRERWLDFAQGVCTPERIAALKPDGVPATALLFVMQPIAMTLAEDRDGFNESADRSLAWLHKAEAAAAKSKDVEAKDAVAAISVLMHTMNAACLDAFDEPDAADAEVNRAMKALRRMESRRGISGKSTPVRRQVVEALFNTGRDAEANKLLERMLARVDADAEGRKISLDEQATILLLAARIEHIQRADRAETDPAGGIRL